MENIKKMIKLLKQIEPTDDKCYDLFKCRINNGGVCDGCPFYGVASLNKLIVSLENITNGMQMEKTVKQLAEEK